MIICSIGALEETLGIDRDRFRRAFDRFAPLLSKENLTEIYSVGKKYSCKNTVLLLIVPKILTENGEFLAKSGKMRYFLS